MRSAMSSPFFRNESSCENQRIYLSLEKSRNKTPSPQLSRSSLLLLTPASSMPNISQQAMNVMRNRASFHQSVTNRNNSNHHSPVSMTQSLVRIKVEGYDPMNQRNHHVAASYDYKNQSTKTRVRVVEGKNNTMVTPRLTPSSASTISNDACNGNGNNNNSNNNHTVTVPTTKKSFSSHSIFRKFRTKSDLSRSNESLSRLYDAEQRFEEKLRKKSFAHYDAQSMTANLNYAQHLVTVLAKRRNTTTGASAASMLKGEEIDSGDGRSNNLVMSCPFFRNELGGESERIVYLSRLSSEKSRNKSTSPLPGSSFLNSLPSSSSPASSPTANVLINRSSYHPSVSSNNTNGNNHCSTIKSTSSWSTNYASNTNTLSSVSSTSLSSLASSPSPPSPSVSPMYHLPSMARGISLLEDSAGNHWWHKTCPYQLQGSYPNKVYLIDNCDVGATYYRRHFYGLEHQNWFGVDENLGPVAISIRRERCPREEHRDKHQYRLIIRTSELAVLRGAVYETCVPSLSPSGRHHNASNHHAKEVLEYVAPELTLSAFKLGVANADEQLLKLDEQGLTRNYKVGVLYCKAAQSTEEDMYNNQYSSKNLDDFLQLIGDRVRLKGFDKYRAGLDNKTDTTGQYSIYSTYADCEIMFHVSTLLPFTPNNRQQLLRKRHIGNDIVTIIFQESEALPFTPATMRSHFQHVFIIIRILKDGRYQVAVSRAKQVAPFGPPLPKDGIFARNKAFTNFLLAKIINAENAAHRSEKFATMAQRTRHEYLKDLAVNYVTNTTMNDFASASSKLASIFTKKSKYRSTQFVADSAIRGAIGWDMQIEDFGQSAVVDVWVGISCDMLVAVEKDTKDIIFVAPIWSVLGWTSHTSWIKIFFHQGECILLKCKDDDVDEIAEVVQRLKVVSDGCETQELILRRNSMDQLGFQIQREGIVIDVQPYSYAALARLQVNSRLVEICKVAIATLDYDQMIDLLKTSLTVTVTVLPPKKDRSPRQGCYLNYCTYLWNNPATNGHSYNKPVIRQNHVNNNCLRLSSAISPSLVNNLKHTFGDDDNLQDIFFARLSIIR